MGYWLRYQALVGRIAVAPWLKRSVTPALFAEDGAMLVAAGRRLVLPKPTGLRFPVIALAAISAFAGAAMATLHLHQAASGARKCRRWPAF
jgi:hypothetical protein